MERIVISVTQRGQVTLPAEVRRLLGVKTGDKVGFCIEDGQVRVMPLEFTLETAFGSVKPHTNTEDLKELARIAWEDKADATVRKMRGE